MPALSPRGMPAMCRAAAPSGTAAPPRPRFLVVVVGGWVGGLVVDTQHGKRVCHKHAREDA